MSRTRTICVDCKTPCNGVRCRSCNTKRIQPTISSRDYSRNWQLKKKYGLEAGEFEVYWQACRGKCFICAKNMLMPLPGKGQGLDVVAVDHDHSSGKVRGLLCNACNKGLGFFKDNVELMKEAIKYLEVSNDKKTSNAT